MKSKISEEILIEIRRDYYALYDRSPTDASAYLRQVAARRGIHIQTLHRHLKLGVRKPRTADPTVVERHEDHDTFGRLVWKFINDNTFDDIHPSITMAYNTLRRQQRIPEDISRAHIYAAIKRQNLQALSQPLWRRFERRSPMDLWQIDFSKSRFFKHIGNGEIQICEPNFTKRQTDGQSLWFGVAIDDATRVSFAHYFVSKGEDSLAVHSFLLKAFESKEDDCVLQGLPQAIYVDRGSGWSTKTTENGLAKLGIKQIIGADEKDYHGKTIRRSNKKARGKVERMIRSMKENMEQEFFFTFDVGQRFSMMQFNLIVNRWIREWNHRKHPVRTAETKWELFAPALVDMKFAPEEAMAYFNQSTMRKIIGGMINVGSGVRCEAPRYLQLTEQVEVFNDNAGHYVFHNGGRHKLEYQMGTTPEQLEKLKVRPSKLKAGNIRSELEIDVLEGHELRKRFMDELGMPLNAIPEDIWKEFSAFFDTNRTVSEVKLMIAWVREQLQPTLPKNVIRLPLQSLG